MSKLRLHGTSSGYTDIAPTAAAGNNTLTAPTGTGTLALITGSGDPTLTLTGSGHPQLTLTNTSGSDHCGVNFGDSSDTNAGMIQYTNNGDYMVVHTAGSERIRIDSNGNTNISGITTATHFIPTAQPYGTKNLVINGSMQVAQRGTSSTTNGYGSLDRWNVTMGNTDEAFTHSQIELSSSDTGPWAEGFHNAMRIQNGNQTSGWQANSHGVLHQFIEDRDIAQSGWQIESTSSYITVSYWIRSSVAQAFGGHVETYDGTDKTWIWSTGTLSADTWTKITKTIGGDSALSMSNDNGRGLQIQPWFIWGTNYTDSSATLNGWASYNGGKRFTDMTSTWWTTNDATVDITGVQIEVGKAATPFEHRSYAEEHLRCARYYQEQQGGSDVFMYAAKAQGTASADIGVGLVVPLRASPTVTCSAHRLFHSDGVGYSNSSTAPTVVQWDNNHSIHSATIALNAAGHSGITNNECCTWAPSSASILFDSEL